MTARSSSFDPGQHVIRANLASDGAKIRLDVELLLGHRGQIKGSSSSFAFVVLHGVFYHVHCPSFPLRGTLRAQWEISSFPIREGNLEYLVWTSRGAGNSTCERRIQLPWRVSSLWLLCVISRPSPLSPPSAVHRVLSRDSHHSQSVKEISNTLRGHLTRAGNPKYRKKPQAISECFHEVDPFVT